MHYFHLMRTLKQKNLYFFAWVWWWREQFGLELQALNNSTQATSHLLTKQWHVLFVFAVLVMLMLNVECPCTFRACPQLASVFLETVWTRAISHQECCLVKEGHQLYQSLFPCKKTPHSQKRCSPGTPLQHRSRCRPQTLRQQSYQLYNFSFSQFSWAGLPRKNICSPFLSQLYT